MRRRRDVALQRMRPSASPNQCRCVGCSTTSCASFRQAFSRSSKLALSSADLGRSVRSEISIALRFIANCSSYLERHSHYHSLGFQRFVLDLMMPEMDGFAVVAALQKEGGWQDIPVIVMTAPGELHYWTQPPMGCLQTYPLARQPLIVISAVAPAFHPAPRWPRPVVI
jgi:CheY-like chemotaxis protein